MKLVANWRHWPRWISMWCMTINGAIAITWLALPPTYQAKIPPEWVMRGVILFVITGIIGRMVNQTKPCPPPDEDPKS